MADLANVVGVGVLPAHQLGGVLKAVELHETKVNRENKGRDHQPSNNPGKRSAGDGAENEANEPARSACEHAVDCFVNGLGTGREATQTESG